MPDYDDLVADIPIWLASYDVDITASAVPRVIQMAQMQIARELPAQVFKARVTGTLSGTNQITWPSDLMAPRYAQVTVSGGYRQLQFKEIEYMRQVWSSTQASGVPYAYGVLESGVWEVAPWPNSSYPYEIGYRLRLPFLSSSLTSNWLTEFAYDLLLWRSLQFGAMFQHDDRQESLVQFFKGQGDGVLAGLTQIESEADRDQQRVPYNRPPRS